MITDPAKWPKKFAEAPMLAELVKAGKLPPVEQRFPHEPLVVKPLQRDRQVRRHLAARLHRPRRRRERQPHQRRPTSCCSGTPTGTKIVPVRRQGLRAERRRQDLHAVPAQGHEVVGRRAVHRRRLHVLVRGHLPATRTSCRRRSPDMSPQRQARQASVKVDETTVRSSSTSRISCSMDMHGRRHADRRRAGGAAVAASSASAPMRPAHYLKQFLPKYSSVEAVNARAKAGGLRQLGADAALQEGLGAQPRAAGARPVEDACSRSTPRPGCWSATRTTRRSTPTGNQLPYIDQVS